MMCFSLRQVLMVERPKPSYFMKRVIPFLTYSFRKRKHKISLILDFRNCCGFMKRLREKVIPLFNHPLHWSNG